MWLMAEEKHFRDMMTEREGECHSEISVSSGEYLSPYPRGKDYRDVRREKSSDRKRRRGPGRIPG